MHWRRSQQCLPKLPNWWNWSPLFRMKTYIAGGSLVLYWIIFFFLTSFTNLSKSVKFCSEFLVLFAHYFFAAITPCCHVQHVSDTFVFLTITLIVICFFYSVKSWYLDFLCTFTLCQLTLSARQVRTCAEVRENAFPSSSLLIASNLCRSGCSQECCYPYVLLHST